ncbi:BTAD domain-containing putative transcriptional regulator [Micromonospora sp. NPDC051925]|uniref:BTAD domain-containing putative transcriptional regulator n=1 Tax=Micromonospora sp. NPDC051925 TaxID=3364288 RepID=UPI0037C52708
MPDQDALVAFFGGGVTDRMVVNLLAVAIWLVWALFAQAVVAELRDTTRGVKDLHQRRHRNPMRTAASVLISSMLLGSVLAATAATAGPQPVRATADAPIAAAQAAPVLTRAAEGPTIVYVGNERYVYVVKRGDYLSKISQAWLGDADRWPEICQLNKHRHFPRAGGTLRDCNIIYPGWDLRLPVDARPPAGATPAQPPAQPPSPVITPPTTVPSAAPSSPAVTPSPSVSPSTAVDGPVIVPSTVPASPPAVTSAPASPSPIPSPSSSPAPSESPSAAPAASDTPSPAVTTDEHGVQMESNWMPWALAIAISTAAALVWLQRRRRYTGQPDNDPPTELPPPVVKLRRAVARHPELAHADTGTDSTEVPTLAPDLAQLPAGGTGIIGDGATAAARAALVAVLASGSPDHPDARGEVVIDAATLATLLGSEVVTLGPWPRLHVADSMDEALTVIESRLLHRSRILDEHALSDLGELRQQAPDEEALPPVMLITETPPAGARMRAKVALALGEGLHVSALLLGEWAHGATVEVATDGHTKLVSGTAVEPVPPRLPVLGPATAIQILTTLREAQTGEPPAIASEAVPVTVVPLHASRTSATLAETTEVPAPVPAAGPAGSARAKLRLIGPPRIEDITAEGRPLRAKALELAVYLAVHPDGAATREIGEYLEPDARISQADQRVHTNASNLRHVLGRAGTADAKNGYVIKSAGRYRLDPATVDVDVWTLRDLMRKATIASGPNRRELLTAACDLYTAPLAEGQDYEWLPPHRETVRRWGTEAHLLLADHLLDTHHPQEASDLLDKAIGLDRYNEALYVRAMHARHALGDADGIRTLLRALTKALADLDAEPQEDTITLATQLRTSLDDK